MGSCWRIHRDESGETRCELEPIGAANIAAPVVVAVSHSALNYKDALAITGTGQILRRFPLIPGIDLAGTVLHSTDPRWEPDAPVFATGWGLGEDRDGGLASHCGLEAAMLLPIPEDRDAAAMMQLGTAGLTAMQAVRALRHHGVRPAQGPIAVTGATGGVASVAIAVLSRLGFTVHAVTGKSEAVEAVAQLHALGATGIIDRKVFTAGAGQAMEREAYAGGVDCTGGEPLAALVRRTRRYGAVATCGVAAGSELPLTVFPFILRGVALLGVSSVRYPQERRRAAWDELLDLLPVEVLAPYTRMVPLEQVPTVAAAMIAGRHSGRTVVDCG